MAVPEKILRRSEWTSPSNIALIKYWGKHGIQLPANPSLSLTLKNSVTRTIVSQVKSTIPTKPQFFFGGVPAPGFESKIGKFLKNVQAYFPFLKENSLKIESWNTFPHSAGIASSASSMSALALCLCDISGEIGKDQSYNKEFFQRASEIARIGSGSASRSVYGGFTLWGKTPLVKYSADEYAVHLNFDVHPVFSKLQDSVLIVSPAEKKISSSKGHRLMDTHPYASARYCQAEKNLEILLLALKSGNIDDFVRITENEALGLHSLMMSSDPGFMLMEPGTIEIINKIRDFRSRSGLFLCFTLDAGPNVHLIYPDSGKKEIVDFIGSELSAHCDNGMVLWDECGEGPTKIK